MTPIITGSIIAVVGFVFFVLALLTIITKKDIPIFKYLVTKSSLLWKDKAVYFYLVVGVILMIVGTLIATSVIWIK